MTFPRHITPFWALAGRPALQLKIHCTESVILQTIVNESSLPVQGGKVLRVLGGMHDWAALSQGAPLCVWVPGTREEGFSRCMLGNVMKDAARWLSPLLSVPTLGVTRHFYDSTFLSKNLTHGDNRLKSLWQSQWSDVVTVNIHFFLVLV